MTATSNPIVCFLCMAAAACAFQVQADAAARTVTTRWTTGFASSATTATTTTVSLQRLRRTSLQSTFDGSDAAHEGETKKSGPAFMTNRREAILTAGSAAAFLFALPDAALADIEGIVSVPQSSEPPQAKSSLDDGGNSVTLFKTKSGLQYIDILEGTGPTPRYGNFVTISYKEYVKLPDIKGKQSKFDEVDSESGFLMKHGNGRSVPGLDEGLHTMRIGGRRRIIIPPKLGYVASGLGPIPEGPYGRWKLNRLLDRMVEVKGGNIVFDVELRSIMEDEADQGYYDDKSLTPEEFSNLRDSIQASQKDARNNE